MQPACHKYWRLKKTQLTCVDYIDMRDQIIQLFWAIFLNPIKITELGFLYLLAIFIILKHLKLVVIKFEKDHKCHKKSSEYNLLNTNTHTLYCSWAFCFIILMGVRGTGCWCCWKYLVCLKNTGLEYWTYILEQQLTLVFVTLAVYSPTDLLKYYCA